MNKVGISLGWNCHSAVYGVNSGVRLLKSQGYTTCPFDTMVSNIGGIIKCLEDDFEFFYDPEYLKVIHVQGDEYSIYNTKYNFGYNHESPGHGNLYINEGWPEGSNHFINNDFYHFKQRYEKRVNNFRNYLLNKNNYISFIITSWNKTQDDMKDLKCAIEKHYPDLQYEIIIINDPNGKEYYMKHMRDMGYTDDDYEIKRLL
jgi:hypothetical protein